MKSYLYTESKPLVNQSYYLPFTDTQIYPISYCIEVFYGYIIFSVSSVQQQSKMRCNGAMMMLVSVLLVGVCAALPSQEARAVANPRTPNQILDAIFERTVNKFR